MFLKAGSSSKRNKTMKTEHCEKTLNGKHTFAVVRSDMVKAPNHRPSEWIDSYDNVKHCVYCGIFDSEYAK